MGAIADGIADPVLPDPVVCIYLATTGEDMLVTEDMPVCHEQSRNSLVVVGNPLQRSFT
jgi:hypothetical protein